MNFATEEQLSEMMSNPAVAQSMNEALSNPAFIDYLIQTNPALRNVPNAREVIQSPMFRHMLTDPETMRAMSRMRGLMGGGARGADAFPAPGATDNTPSDAAASPSAGAGATGAGGAGGAAGANPFGSFNPLMFGFPGAAGAGGAGGAGGDAAANPFASLFQAGFGAAAGAGATPGAAAGTDPNAAGANTAAGEGAGAGAGAGAAGAGAAANPFGSLFGGAGMPGFGQITPEQMQQAMRMLSGGAGGAAGGAGFNPYGAFSPPAQQDTRSPEEQYASQLRQLNEMGFYDFDQNVAALRRSGGSVEGALAHLLGN